MVLSNSIGFNELSREFSSSLVCSVHSSSPASLVANKRDWDISSSLMEVENFDWLMRACFLTLYEKFSMNLLICRRCFGTTISTEQPTG